jgi:UTP---glucose-1-phosphate uridylyltransferase
MTQHFFCGKRCGRCKLQKVKVSNKGLDWSSPKNVYWKNAVERCESLKIFLHGNAEFEASDFILELRKAPIFLSNLVFF